MKHDSENLDPSISQKIDITTDCYRVCHLVKNGYILVARQKFEEIVCKRYLVEDLETTLAETAIVLLETYDKNQQHKEILDFFKKYEDLLKDHPIALTITGAASKNLNDPQQAKSFLTRAIQSDISYPDPHLLLGDLYSESKPKLAVNHYRQYNECHSSILGARVFVKRIKSLLNAKESPILFKDLPIAFIGNFTIEPIRVSLEVECFKQSINPRFYFGGYDQYVQEISNPDSFLYQFNPVVTFFFLDNKTLLPELFNNFFELSSEKRLLLAEEKIKLVRTLCNEFIERSKSHLVISNFLFSEECYMGVYDSKLVNGQKEILEKMNSKLLNHTRENIRRFHFLDTEKVLSNYGKTRCSNEKMRYLAKMVIPDQTLPYLARELMRFIRPIMGQTKKCLVLDLDNTLWGGVLGEEGLEGIKLDPDEPPGNAFWEFQKAIKNLQKRGIILAINSKNDFDLVRNVFQNHPYMQLKLSDFACIRANWQDKAQNMRGISKELNLGLSSFVYFDDNPAERYLVSRELPEVLTIDVPKDCSEFTRYLLRLDVFETLHITDEDKNRTKLYIAEGERKEFQTKVTDLSSYLKALNIKVEVCVADGFSIPRIAQLTQRTNQFNLTTKRYSESDISSFSDSNSNLVYYMKSGDRFGDHGIVGSCILYVHKDTLEIDTFLLSCRVVGRGIEQAFLYYICQNAIKKSVKKITGRFFPTQKNKISEPFYTNMGFKIISETVQEKVFTLDLPNNCPSLPTHINTINYGK
jgi:FkbH-like protein